MDIARQHAPTAAIVAALLPLAAVPARAVLSTTSVDAVFGTDASTGSDEVTYTITNNSITVGNVITGVEIPEINAGDLRYSPAFSSAPSLPSGWSADETSTPSSGASVPGGTASAYLELKDSTG